MPTRPAKRSAPSSSSSVSSDADDGDSGESRAAMLAALEAHGRSLFGFASPEPTNGESSAQGARRLSGSSEEVSDVDWDSDDVETDEGEMSDEDGEMSDEEAELQVIGTVNKVTGQMMVPEVVFAAASRRPELVSKAERRAFLNGNSSKLMGLKLQTDDFKTKKRRKAEVDDEDDQSNTKLDKTLHDMLLTNLLPSHHSSTAQRPVDKQKAISGRLLELASYELPGEGSSSISRASLSSHPAKVRTGIIQAKARKEAKAKDEAEAGSWVRGIGTVGTGKGKTVDKGRQKRSGLGTDVGTKKGMEGRKEGRSRGLAMGVGKFKAGMLSLSAREIARGSETDRSGGGHRGKKRFRR